MHSWLGSVNVEISQWHKTANQISIEINGSKFWQHWCNWVWTAISMHFNFMVQRPYIKFQQSCYSIMQNFVQNALQLKPTNLTRFYVTTKVASNLGYKFTIPEIHLYPFHHASPQVMNACGYTQQQFHQKCTLITNIVLLFNINKNIACRFFSWNILHSNDAKF